MNGTWDDNSLSLYSKIHLRWLLKNGNWDYSFKSIVESKAKVNGTWDDNSLSLHSKIHLRWLLKKMGTETTYSFKSIVESKAKVNGTWDNNPLSSFKNSLALVAKKRELRLRTALSRSLKVRPTWTGSGPETTTSFKSSLALVAKKQELRLQL